MQSNRVRLMLVALFGVLALGALTAAAAQAVEAPRWNVGGFRLGAGETHYIAAETYSPHLALVTGNVTIICAMTKLKEGSLLGSNVGNAGKSNEVVEFSTCTVSGSAGGKAIEKCKVDEPIKTNPIVAELVESEGAKPAENKGSLLTLFEPATGTSFATLKFKVQTEGNCPPETKVTGKVAAKVLVDPENGTEELGEWVNLEHGTEEKLSWLQSFPAKPITKVVKIRSGVVTEEAIPGLTAFSEIAVLEGTVLLLLADINLKGELESEGKTKWSPVP